MFRGEGVIHNRPFYTRSLALCQAFSPLYNIDFLFLIFKKDFTLPFVKYR